MATAQHNGHLHLKPIQTAAHKNAGIRETADAHHNYQRADDSLSSLSFRCAIMQSAFPFLIWRCHIAVVRMSIGFGRKRRRAGFAHRSDRAFPKIKRKTRSAFRRKFVVA